MKVLIILVIAAIVIALFFSIREDIKKEIDNHSEGGSGTDKVKADDEHRQKGKDSNDQDTSSI